ncbi:hypothetical protein LR48_Vigan10g175500 [Vigna angularis]|uniref:Uncharacterized protein n=1 Tax=Phaseolus angularis TaxID=3914 RepID=A0A0L9VLK8_PHAAN|nr:hypothetical protein LR48_Vigan10g175500 [Vigna angularis]
MALCLPLSFSNPKRVASLSSSFVHGGTKPSSFSINEKLKTGNRLQNVSVSISCSSIKLVHDRALDKHIVMKYRVRESKRMRRERRKSRFRKDIGSLNEANQNNSESDDDYDDNIGIDNFENVYDDGFENTFEELDFEAEDDDDDQGNKIFSQSNYGEFWTSG